MIEPLTLDRYFSYQHEQVFYWSKTHHCLKGIHSYATICIDPKTDAPLSRHCRHPCSDVRQRSRVRCRCSRARTSAPSLPCPPCPRRRATWGSASPPFCYLLPSDSMLAGPWRVAKRAASNDGRPGPRSISRNFALKVA